MTISVCDLCDTHEGEFVGSNAKQLRLLPDAYKSYGGMASFHGQAHTLRCPEDNSRVREAVAQPGEGRVLVVDGGGMTRRALVGGNLAVTAAKNGWAGILVHGAVRDMPSCASRLSALRLWRCAPCAQISAAWAMLAYPS